MGGFCASIVRIWTGDVCVRSSSRSSPSPPPFTKNVSTASRAGWSGREVERPEVQPVGLDVRAVRDLVAQRREGGFDPPPHDGQRVQPPDARGARRQRHVHRERPLPLLAFEENRRFFECGECGLHVLLERVDGRAGRSLVFLRKVFEALQEIRDDALLLPEPTHVQSAHIRREEAPRSRPSPRRSSTLRRNLFVSLRRLKKVRHRSCASSAGAYAPALAAAAGSPRAVFADATMFANPFGSSTAISARTLRFTSDPAFLRPAMSLL